MPATLTADERRRTRFGQALTEAMQVRDLTQAALGELLGQMRQSSISAWTSGAALPPDVETVFHLERVLKLKAGQLSKLLGFLPVGPSQAPVSVLEAVRNDTQLDERARRILVATYKEVAAAKRRHPSAHKVKRARVA